MSIGHTSLTLRCARAAGAWPAAPSVAALIHQMRTTDINPAASR